MIITFSIIIPTYNRKLKLEKAIKSVISQTYNNFELIIIDNGSTDNTEGMVKSYNDQRIKYYQSENNGGPAKPRNLGISLAKGEWICFLDDDDWWTIDKLNICKKYLNDQVDFLYHDLIIVKEKSMIFHRRKVKSWQVKIPVLQDLLLRGNAIANSSVVVRKTLLRKINGFIEDKKMISVEDYNAWLRISQHSERFLYINKKLGYYYDQNKSISKRDMSIPLAYAVEKFLPILSSRQKNMMEATIIYTKAKFFFSEKNYYKSKKYALFCIKKLNKLLLIKGILMLTLIFFIEICESVGIKNKR